MSRSAPITVLIADDEAIARNGLVRMLAELSWMRVVGEAANGIEAVAAIDALKPELVLLDIQMPGLIGTDVLQQVRHKPQVIFTTAYSQHAVTAFELGALDYLLKPFGEARLGAALERVRAAYGEPHTSLDRLGEAMSHRRMTRLFVRTGRSITPLLISEISRFEAVGDYTAAHAGGAPHLLHLSLNQLEARVDPHQFLRIHRAHLVNLDHVAAFRRDAAGQVRAELRDKTLLPVSRAKARELREVAK
ncbi:MAG: response regulator transcription factor [Rhodanobacteraceae bacterium]|nr:response regulator transcription factor [Rhodanobacteraceae bacterium]